MGVVLKTVNISHEKMSDVSFTVGTSVRDLIGFSAKDNPEDRRVMVRMNFRNDEGDWVNSATVDSESFAELFLEITKVCERIEKSEQR